MTWPSVQIKDVARVVGGATPRTSVSAYWDGDVDWATPKDLSDLPGKCISETPRRISAAGLRDCAAELLPPNSVLFSSRAPIGHVAINSVPMATNQGFKSMVPGPKLDASFLYWWLDCHRERLQALGNGATFKEVSKAIVERIEIPLPPLAEQKRIAAILDQADALRRLRRRALDRLNSLGQAIFQEMFGDPVSGATDFPRVHVHELIEGFETGKNIAEDPDGTRQARFNVLKVSAVTSGFFRPEEAKPLPASYDPPASHIVRDGDLLFSRANTEALIGATAFVRGDAGNFVLPDKIWRFVWRKKSPVTPEFVKFLFDSDRFRDQIRKRSTGTSGSMKNISQSKVLSIQVGLPPVHRQADFSDRLAHASRSKERSDASLHRLESLFASLQHRAFTGQL